MPRKVFTREMLTSAELNEYLMDQTVMRFTSASQRSTMLPDPEPGMVTYLEDSGRLEMRNLADTAWQYLNGPSDAAAAAITLTGVASGWSVGSATGQKLERGFAAVAIVLNKTGSTITVPAGGDIANIDLATLPAAYIPLGNPIAHVLGTGRMHASYIQAGTGLLRLTATVPGADIVAGNSLEFGATYPLANP